MYIYTMNITRHAMLRMTQRGFTGEMLGKLLGGRKAVLSAELGRFRIVGNVGDDYWTLVVEEDLYTLVTVRRAHEDEICLLSKK